MLSISLLGPVLPASLPRREFPVFVAAVELGASRTCTVGERPPSAGGLPPAANPPARPKTNRKIPPYRLGVNSEGAATAGVSELQRTRGRENAAYLWIRVLAVAAIAFVVTTSFQARRAPGDGGQALGVAFALIVFCGATTAAMWLTLPRPAVQMAVL